MDVPSLGKEGEQPGWVRLSACKKFGCEKVYVGDERVGEGALCVEGPGKAGGGLRGQPLHSRLGVMSPPRIGVAIGDSVHCPLLWRILSVIGCPQKFI